MKSMLPRTSGLLLHPSSLPGPFGIGDLGPVAERWVDHLEQAGQSWWQILPLGPTGAGNSPYQSFSAFAGNICLLSPERLQQDGLLDSNDLNHVNFPAHRVDFEHVAIFKEHLLRQAWAAFQQGKAKQLQGEFESYCKRERSWLDDYAEFMTIRETLGGKPLHEWPSEFLHRNPEALTRLREQQTELLGRYRFGQFLFDRQWLHVKAYANERGVRIIGDAPIFVSRDSSDVWANPDYFLLDPNFHPKVVAGVPPDYFSPTGQHWGNPLYDWKRMQANQYDWWVARVRRLLVQTDLVRIDHFRAFAAAWHIPAEHTDAMNGKWVPGPGRKLFDRLREVFEPLPLIAEDLGLISEDVHQLRADAALPGMRVLQFAVGGVENTHWPHNYEPDTIAYTGTHDNDTTPSWYNGLDAEQKQELHDTLGPIRDTPTWDMIRHVWASVAYLAIAPMQDILDLGGDARLNVPGKPTGNWEWRLTQHQLDNADYAKLKHLTMLYNRVPQPAIVK